MTQKQRVFLSIAGIIVGAGVIGYCSYRWLKLAFQNQLLNYENTNLRNQNNNIVQQNRSWKERFVATYQENHELKSQLTVLATESKKLLESQSAPTKRIAGFGRNLTVN